MLVSLKELTQKTRDEGEELGDLEWLYHEILTSLPQDVIEQAHIRQEVNVQLMIDNVVVEPMVLNDLLTNIDKYINQQAEAKVKEKFVALEERFQDIMGPLESATKEATDKIKEEFNITEDKEN